MIVVNKDCTCSAKPDPKAWTSGSRSGITYRATFSDGKSSLDLRCKDADVYGKIEPFGQYQIALDVLQAAQDDRIVERVVLVDVAPVE